MSTKGESPDTTVSQDRQFVTLLECSFSGNPKDAEAFMHTLQQQALAVVTSHHPTIKKKGHHGSYVGFDSDPFNHANNIASIARASLFFLSKALAQLPTGPHEQPNDDLLRRLLEINSMIADLLHKVSKAKKSTTPQT